MPKINIPIVGVLVKKEAIKCCLAEKTNKATKLARDYYLYVTDMEDMVRRCFYNENPTEDIRRSIIQDASTSREFHISTVIKEAERAKKIGYSAMIVFNFPQSEEHFQALIASANRSHVVIIGYDDNDREVGFYHHKKTDRVSGQNLGIALDKILAATQIPPEQRTIMVNRVCEEDGRFLTNNHIFYRSMRSFKDRMDQLGNRA